MLATVFFYTGVSFYGTPKKQTLSWRPFSRFATPVATIAPEGRGTTNATKYAPTEFGKLRFFGEAQHARWTLSGSKGHTTILLSLFAVFKQNIWGDHFPSFARRKINQWSNLRKTHTYPHAREPSTATHQDVPVSSSKFSNATKYTPTE